MRLTALRIGSFGGIARRTLDFMPELNIVLGPNESGKSTVFAALEAAFTVPSRPKGKVRKSFLERFLPLAGGDTIDVTVEFETSSGAYSLEKRWGEDPAAVLILPGGGRVTGDEPVHERLTEILGFGLGTLKNVFLTGQSGLERTLEDLVSSEGKDTLHDLADILQTGFLEADGISVTRFREILEAGHQDYFSNWDIRRNGPAEKKGHSTGRWSREVGRILAAYYELEDRKRKAREIEEQERRLRELFTREKSLSGSVGRDRAFLDTHKASFEDIDRRNTLEARIQASKRKQASLNEDYNNWLTSRGRYGELEKQLVKAEEEKRRAREVLAEAKRNAVKRTRRARYTKLKELKDRLETLEQERKGLPEVNREDVHDLRDTERRRDVLKGKLESGRVRIELEARKELELSAAAGNEEARKLTVRPGEPVVLTEEGRLTLQHRDWRIAVSAGEEDSKRLEEEIEKAEKSVRDFLASRGFTDTDEAEETLGSIRALDERIRETRKIFEEESAETSLEELEKELAPETSDSGTEGAVDLETAESDFNRTREEYEQVSREVEYLSRDISKLEERYESPEKVLDEILAIRNEERTVEDELGALASLPGGYSTVEEFRNTYRNTRDRWEREREELLAVNAEIELLEKTMPEMTAEQAAAAVSRQNREFERVRSEGIALDTVKRYSEAILEEVSRNPYGGLTERVSEYLNELTSNRYSAETGEEGLPASCVGGERTAIGYRYLSAGTKDAFALAMRLAMAEYFGDTEGRFFILDDPLVDLDPQRQRAAAGTLENFSGVSQCILFTCHPSHAELFPTGRVIEL